MTATLADSLDLIHEYFMASLTDCRIAATFARDWPTNSRTLALALARVGGRAAWLDRNPTSLADDTPYVVASLETATAQVRFEAATAGQARGIAAAEMFDWRGGRLSA